MSSPSSVLIHIFGNIPTSIFQNLNTQEELFFFLNFKSTIHLIITSNQKTFLSPTNLLFKGNSERQNILYIFMYTVHPFMSIA